MSQDTTNYDATAEFQGRATFSQKMQAVLHKYPWLSSTMVLVVASITFSFFNENFLTPSNFSLILQQVAIVGMRRDEQHERVVGDVALRLMQRDCARRRATGLRRRSSRERCHARECDRRNARDADAAELAPKAMERLSCRCARKVHGGRTG